MSTENNEDSKEMNKNKPKTNNKMETFGLYFELISSKESQNINITSTLILKNNALPMR